MNGIDVFVINLSEDELQRSYNYWDTLLYATKEAANERWKMKTAVIKSMDTAYKWEFWGFPPKRVDRQHRNVGFILRGKTKDSGRMRVWRGVGGR